MSGAAYAVRMLLILSVAVILLFVSFVPLAALHPHWNGGDFCDPFEALAGAMFCSGCVWMFVVITVAPFALSVLIAVWIYYDARRRGDPSAVPWALLGFMLNVVGWIVYLIARSQPVMYAQAAAPAPPAQPPAVPPAPPVTDEGGGLPGQGGS
jgi:hypothetical protein